MIRLSLLLILGIIVACGGDSVGQEKSRTGSPATATSALQASVTVGQASFAVELAATPAVRAQGLSGRPSLAPATGMLFVFEREGTYPFWMKDMLIPLDMVWIGAGCTVVDISRDVPAPKPGQDVRNLPTYSPSAPVIYVLEINAGAADQAGLHRGDLVAFTGSLSGKYGC